MYGIDLKIKNGLIKLLQEISGLKYDFKIRLMYLNPDTVNAQLLKFISDNPKICNYIDMPVQHTENVILKNMRRGYTRQDIIDKIKYIRNYNPDIAIRTVIITGYPGETEKIFNNMLDTLKKLKFDKLAVFPYYDEPGTYSYKLPESTKIADELKGRRLDKIMRQQMAISLKINEKYVGRTLPVLIDGFDKKSGYYLGRSEFNAPEIDGYVFFKKPEDKKNIDIIKFSNIKVKSYSEYDLVGECVL